MRGADFIKQISPFLFWSLTHGGGEEKAIEPVAGNAKNATGFPSDR
jgi:hypothetical protein